MISQRQDERLNAVVMRRERSVEGRELAGVVKRQKRRSALGCGAFVEPRHALCNLVLQVRHGEDTAMNSERGRTSSSVTREHDVGNGGNGTSDVLALVRPSEKCHEAPGDRRSTEREKSEKREHMPSLHAPVPLMRARRNAGSVSSYTRCTRSSNPCATANAAAFA